MLLKIDGGAWSTGNCGFFDDIPEDPSDGKDARIVVRCMLKRPSVEFHAVVDTATPWCILTPEIAKIAGLPTQNEPSVRLSTRYGSFEGVLERARIEIPADEGESLRAEATFWISEDWRGPNFLGWGGLLQSIRFAVDPTLNKVHFGIP